MLSDYTRFLNAIWQSKSISIIVSRYYRSAVYYNILFSPSSWLWLCLWLYSVIFITYLQVEVCARCIILKYTSFFFLPGKAEKSKCWTKTREHPTIVASPLFRPSPVVPDPVTLQNLQMKKKKKGLGRKGERKEKRLGEAASIILSIYSSNNLASLRHYCPSGDGPEDGQR